MVGIERKIDILLRAIAAEDNASFQEAVNEARKLLKEEAMNTPHGTEIISTYVRNEIDAALTEIGIARHLRGFDYLVEAIYLVITDQNIIYKMTTELYPTIAKVYGTTVSRVDRALRFAIETAYDCGCIDIIIRYIGNVVPPTKDKATNRMFINGVAKHIRDKIYGTCG